MSNNIVNPRAARDDNCSICLDNLTNEQIYELPECGHKFHTNCIFHWLRCGHNKCPNCNNSGLNNSLTDDSESDYYHSYNRDQYIILRRFSRNKNAPLELKKLVQQLKKLELKHSSICKEIKQLKNKKGVFKELKSSNNKKIAAKYNINYRIHKIKKTMCHNITQLILVKKLVI